MSRSPLAALLLCATGFLLIAHTAFAVRPAVPPAPTFLLPDDVLPKKNIVDLIIDPNKSTFDGSTRIEVELARPVTTIWLNAKDLEPHDASVEFAGHPQLARATIAGEEFLGLELSSPVGPGRATLSIRYRGLLDKKSLVGPYRKRVANNWYVFTTFTPIEARRAFPCFDEPRFKTPWELTIHVKRGERAFSNAAALTETDEPHGWKAVHFAPTAPLPAEVVAFAVGPFDIWDGGAAGHNTAIRVITAKGQAAQGKAAGQATAAVLPRLEAYTGIPYPFGKLDHLALPEGAFGAVENPGLITYRRRELLPAIGEDTPDKTQKIRSLEAHEIAHQWFGNLVTPAGWDDVWLSESFATWLAAKVMDEEQSPARQNLASAAARAEIMLTDESPRTRPVRFAAANRQTMRGIYSPFVYEKGASILLMLENWLGPDRFRAALRAYLQQHANGNATTADLESALRAATGVDPSAVMHSFLDQTGIPRITAEVRCDPGSAPKLEFKQTNAAHTWTVPVCWRTDRESACTLLDSPRREVALTACPAWIDPNAGGMGYYRTEWSPAQLAALSRGFTELTAAERMTLLFELPDNAAAAPIVNRLFNDPVPDIAKMTKALISGQN